MKPTHEQKVNISPDITYINYVILYKETVRIREKKNFFKKMF